jgi:nicotinate-nucleotide pyrophosphorylase (carboxylating)
MNSGHDEAGLRCDLIALALSEDLGDRGDVTSQAFIPSASTSFARIVAREECIVSGLSTALEVFRRIDPQLEVTLRCSEGERLSLGATLIELKGSTRSILSGERTALNFLGRLCGIATLSGCYAEKARGTKTVLLDTRKTTPGWRLLEKQAVKAGGCTNHRMGLHDAVLVKDNHLAALGSLDALPAVISKLRAEHPGLPIEVEADTLEQLERLLTMTGIDVILLDNMDATMMRKALTLRNTLSAAVLLEASGGVTLETLRQIADTGVDRISVGALTHSAPNTDLSMELGHAF